MFQTNVQSAAEKQSFKQQTLPADLLYQGKISGHYYLQLIQFRFKKIRNVRKFGF